MVKRSKRDDLYNTKIQMKLFTAIATAVVLGGSLIATATPASAQYYGTSTYTVRPRANGFQVRDSCGNYTTTPTVEAVDTTTTTPLVDTDKSVSVDGLSREA